MVGPFLRGAHAVGIGGDGHLWLGSDAVTNRAIWEDDAVLSSNATLRNLTSARASDLSAVHESIAATSTYANISLGYYRPALRALVSNYTSQTGRDPKDLFEPSDGFHPSQLANALLAEQLWLHLEANYPHALGQTNPHNAEIERLFGDQGGF